MSPKSSNASARLAAISGACSAPVLLHEDVGEEERRPELLASRCCLQLARLLRESPAGQRKRGCRSTRRTLVQRTDRRPVHQAQAGETSDVWSRETRSSPRKTDRRWMTSRMTCTEIESEPRLDAKTAPQGVTIAREFTP